MNRARAAFIMTHHPDKAVVVQMGATAPRPLMIGLALTVVAMAIVIALAAVSTFQRDERQRMVEHTLNVQQAIMRTLSLMQDAETGQRGFMVDPRLERAPALAPPYNIRAQPLIGDGGFF